MKFGFFTDTHFTLRCASRADNVLSSLVSKTGAALSFFVDSGCEFVIFGGDMFDRHRELNFELLSSVWSVFSECPLPIYFIMGNHDESGYRWQTIIRSSVGFLSNLLPDKLVFVEDFIELPDCVIYAHHAGQDLKERQSLARSDDRPLIFVSHCLLADNTNIGNVHINAIDNKDIDLVLSGDLHDGYPLQTNKHGIYCYNPGSVGRMSRHDINRVPKVATFGFEKLFGRWAPCISEFSLECLDGEILFPIREELPSTSDDSEPVEEKYIDVFRQFRGDSRDIYDALERAGRAAGIDDAVLALINSYKNCIK